MLLTLNKCTNLRDYHNFWSGLILLVSLPIYLALVLLGYVPVAVGFAALCGLPTLVLYEPVRRFLQIWQIGTTLRAVRYQFIPIRTDE